MSFEAEFTEITISSGWGEPRALPLSLATSANILTPCSSRTRSITEWIPPSRGIRLCGRSAGSISQEIRRLFIGRSFIRRRDFPICEFEDRYVDCKTRRLKFTDSLSRECRRLSCTKALSSKKPAASRLGQQAAQHPRTTRGLALPFATCPFLHGPFLLGSGRMGMCAIDPPSPSPIDRRHSRLDTRLI